MRAHAHTHIRTHPLPRPLTTRTHNPIPNPDPNPPNHAGLLLGLFELTSGSREPAVRTKTHAPTHSLTHTELLLWLFKLTSGSREPAVRTKTLSDVKDVLDAKRPELDALQVCGCARVHM